MANFNLDRLKYNWRGTWNPSVDFAKDDIVYYEGKAYACLTAHTSSTNFYADKDADFVDQNVVVTVGADTFDNQRQGHFYLDFNENPVFTLLKGRTYIFRQNDATNIEYNTTPSPLLISTIENGTRSGGGVYGEGVKYYLDDVEVTVAEYTANFSTATTRELHFTVPQTAPNVLYYYSHNQIDMGGKINSKYSSYWDKIFDGKIWKGDWTGETNYAEGNIVKYNGILYQAIQGHTSPATEDTIYESESFLYWQLYQKTVKFQGLWTGLRQYFENDVVKDGGNIYVANQNHISSGDAVGIDANSELWDKIILSDKWMNNWIINNLYSVNDIVRYGGIIYRCIEGHTSAAIDRIGLELDLDKWEVIVAGINFKNNWQPGIRYKANDVIKFGASLYICIIYHTSNDDFLLDDANWQIYLPGLEFDNYWNNETLYQIGDIVVYGGYSYTALKNNRNSNPDLSLDGSNLDWELLIRGYNHRGEFEEGIVYKSGDVINYGGNLYIARRDALTDIRPGTNEAIWQILVPGKRFRAEWNDNVLYFEGDIVLYAGTAYLCIQEHYSYDSGSRPDLDKDYTAENYWEIFIQGSTDNVLTAEGDILVHDDTDVQRLPIGSLGSVLNTQNNFPIWKEYETVPEVYFVSMEGTDRDGGGRTVDSAFATVKFACDYIMNDYDDTKNYTIFVKSGVYQEMLPISIPARCAIVGDELRSTSIQPAPGYELENMFYVRNGSGLRNLSLQGLDGELTAPTEFLTRRVTGGAYVSLDPGLGPEDENVWITSRSPYIQNVSTFGNGCIGMKIDGALHAGGNDSIVANDFTQILSDGIGYWADNLGRSELVSVFTYYCHIGYLATNGGILRATNGNNSYGTYGSVAEGFDVDEIPVTAVVDNISNQAIFGEAVTYGTTEQIVIAIAYSHAGQDYSSANIEFGGSGINAVAKYEDFRKGAISDIRILGPADSSTPGGQNYTSSPNFARAGTTTQISLSNAEEFTVEEIVGQRIVILSGLGVGQYAEIDTYDADLQIATVIRETDGLPGWNHFMPGWPIETVLDDTTRYNIEPKITVSEPVFNFFAITPPGGFDYEYITVQQQDTSFTYVAVQNGVTNPVEVGYSTDGSSWSSNQIGNFVVSGVDCTNNIFAISVLEDNQGSATDITLLSNGGITWNETTLPQTGRWSAVTTDKLSNIYILDVSGDVAISLDDGNTWSMQSIPSTSEYWGLLKYGNGVLVAVDTGSIGSVAYSLDNGTTWNIISNIGLTAFSDITYGNNRFVMVTSTGESAISFDGINWYTDNKLTGGTFAYVTYGSGVFLATGDSNLVAKSADGLLWYTSNSTENFSFGQVSDWKRAVYADGFFTIINSNANLWMSAVIGADPILRATIINRQLDEIKIYDPGSGYDDDIELTIFDNSVTIEALYKVNINDGVLSQPTMVDRGEGYVTITGKISGNGYAEIFQTGTALKVTNLTRLISPGANLTIAGITYGEYVLSSIIEHSEIGPPFSATLRITPSIQAFESPATGTQITLREKYSQVRLTGHDFLDIGTGNFPDTDYPDLYLFGQTPANARQPFNETVGYGGGRVFYTSTDQDGNFRVGDLFKVEQASGVVTISASQFELGGLTELSLGGIQIGGSAVIIREFSKDPTFIADSNNIVPTQRAIKSYIESRVSGGGSNATTNKLVASQVSIENNSITTIDNTELIMGTKSTIIQGIDGHYLAMQIFS